MADNIVLKINFHVTGTTHDGYCSGNEDEDPVDYHYSEEIEVDRKFVREFIEEDGTLDTYKLSDYNKYNTKIGGKGIVTPSQSLFRGNGREEELEGKVPL